MSKIRALHTVYFYNYLRSGPKTSKDSPISKSGPNTRISRPGAQTQSINPKFFFFNINNVAYLGIFHDKSCDERLEQRRIVQVRQDQMIQTVPNSQTLTERPLTLSLERRQVVLVSRLESGLAIKNSPKKTQPKKTKKPLKKPTKNVFFFNFEFFMKIIQTFLILFETDFL
jgi:hypothetical protein